MGKFYKMGHYYKWQPYGDAPATFVIFQVRSINPRRLKCRFILNIGGYTGFGKDWPGYLSVHTSMYKEATHTTLEEVEFIRMLTE